MLHTPEPPEPRCAELWSLKVANLFRILGALLTLGVTSAFAQDSAALRAERSEVGRPNILWISCEDISPHLGCYGDPDADTPNLDRLASEGTRFTHAFSCHGVCAPSRTGIITGMYPVALGANHMRSKVVLPPNVTLFPQLLREAGYYCTNNSKTDYNLHWDEQAVWDESSNKAHWRNRPDPQQPFFAVFNLTMTHESQVWRQNWEKVTDRLSADRFHDPASIQVPGLFPAAQPIREDFARLADLVTVMDQRAGELLGELETAGLSQNTVVFFWSDHGDGLPRCKRWTYDSGSHVPLIIRVPPQLRNSLTVGGDSATVDDRLVSLLDLGPTVLTMAGVPIPGHMHGRSLLTSTENAGEEFVFGARDRIDERFDLVRTVRNRNWRYVRNLMPWRAALQPVAYAEQNATLQELRRQLAAGELPESAAPWFTTPRPAEELYDLSADPYELNNLALDDRHRGVLKDLSSACDAWQLRVGDLHLAPEILLTREESAGALRGNIFSAPDGPQRLANTLSAAKTASRLAPADASAACDQLSSDPCIRWWQVTLIARAPEAHTRIETLRAECRHEDVAIRIAAAAGLARAGDVTAAGSVLRQALQDPSEFVRHAALVEIDEAGPELINQLRDVLPAAAVNEYSKRLVAHALEQ